MSRYALLTTSGTHAERYSTPNTSTATESERTTTSDQKQTQQTEINEVISKKPVMKNKVSSPSPDLIPEQTSEDKKFELFMARMEEALSLTFFPSDQKNTKSDERLRDDARSSSSRIDGLAIAELQYKELQKIFEKFFWRRDEASFENLQKKILELKNSNVNLQGINASSLVLRVAAGQKNDNHDFSPLIITLANLGAKISCRATNRRMLASAIDRNWAHVLEILVKKLRDGKRLAAVTEDMCNFALKPEVSFESFANYLYFSLDREILSSTQIETLITDAMESWKSDPENTNFGKKFVLLIKLTDADINNMKIGRYTAIDWAIKRKHTKMVDALLALGAQPKIGGESKKTD